MKFINKDPQRASKSNVLIRTQGNSTSLPPSQVCQHYCDVGGHRHCIDFMLFVTHIEELYVLGFFVKCSPVPSLFEKAVGGV